MDVCQPVPALSQTLHCSDSESNPFRGVEDFRSQKTQELQLPRRGEASAESDVGQSFTRPSVSSVGTREKKVSFELQQPLEPRLSCSGQSLGLIEESQRRLSELIKRNEEKRGVISELAGQVKELKKENQALHERNRKLTEGNYNNKYYYCYNDNNNNNTQRSANCARASGLSMKNSNFASFAKVKATLMGAFRVRKHKNVK